jgi:hypothetical protein
MVVLATLLDQSAAAVGLVAAAIAVGGFLGHAGLALRASTDEELRAATVVGGLWGTAGAAFIIVLSAIEGAV